MASNVNGCQEALFSGCEGAVPVFGLRIAQPCVPGRPAGRPGTQMLRRESTEGAGSAQRCSCGPLMGTSASSAGPLRTLRGRPVMAHSVVAL